MTKNIIFNCTTFHQFLVLGIENNTDLKRGEKKSISDFLGIHPTLLSQILSGSRTFTEEQVFLLGEYFGLTDLENDYISTLHQLENCQSKIFKAKLVRKKDELKRKSLNLSERVERDKTLTEEEKSVFYSSWHYSAVRMLTSLEDGITKDEIAERLDLERKKVAEILDFLTKLGLCKFEKGRFHLGVSRTHVEKSSPYYRQHHINWRLKSIQGLDSPKDEDLTFTSPTSISREDFELLREQMVKLIQDFYTTVKDSKAEEVYCFNLDFFRI
jgi:uncharacterized protein (TIGR02147 family)